MDVDTVDFVELFEQLDSAGGDGDAVAGSFVDFTAEGGREGFPLLFGG